MFDLQVSENVLLKQHVRATHFQEFHGIYFTEKPKRELCTNEG